MGSSSTTRLLSIFCIFSTSVLIIIAFPVLSSDHCHLLKDLRGGLSSAKLAVEKADVALSNFSDFTPHSSSPVCRYLLDLTLADLRWCILALHRSPSAAGMSKDLHSYEDHRYLTSDLKTRLSSALTNQNICQEDLLGYPMSNNTENGGLKKMAAAKRYLRRAKSTTHKLLSMASRLRYDRSSIPNGKARGLRKTASFWRGRPKLSELVVQGRNPFAASNVTVAQDGSGNFRRIADALSSAPDDDTNGHHHYVIYVKQGVYHEYLKVDYRKHNVVLVGDGIGRTIITGDHSNSSGYSTFNSATLAVDGEGFIAIGLTIENAAGPTAGQAVAVRSGSDFSAFYRCEIKGNQDTLFAISKRQFYRECRISGTVDFIFGNAAAVFQKCDIVSRKRTVGNVIAANSRLNPNEPTGFSFHRCSVWGEPGAPVTYLGRPWKRYARTVFVETTLGHVVAPAGWSGWNNDYLNTLYYAEYRDRGPGARPWRRVKWGGVHALTDRNVAAQFLPTRFIEADRWIPTTGIPYDDRLFG